MPGKLIGGEIFFKDGDSAWDRGEFARARTLFEAGAQLGHQGCRLNLGVLLEAGLGGRASVSEALKWYKRSFRQCPDSASALNIADAYWRKVRNIGRADFWFQRAVELGDGDAAVEYAEMLAAIGRRGHEKRVYALLLQAIASNCITPDGKAKAEAWLSACQPE